jgi:hypothetical protein
LTLTEYSRHRSVSTAAIIDAVNSGRIRRQHDGSIDQLQADLDWGANTDEAQVRERSPRKKRDPSIDVAAGRHASVTWAEKQRQAALNLDPANLGTMSFADAKAIEKNIEAKLKLLELQEREGELLKRQDVLADVEKLCRITRDNLLNIPSRIAAQVIALTELSDVEATIAEEITAALDEMADALKRMAEGGPAMMPRLSKHQSSIKRHR